MFMKTLKQMTVFKKSCALLLMLSTIGIQYSNVLAEDQKIYKRDYTFTQDFFTRNIPLWQQFLGEFRDKPGIHYLEIGVFEGGSIIWMLENILTDPQAKATCVDVFPEWMYDRFTANLTLSGFAHKVGIMQGRSQVMLRRLPLNSYDIIYIDGSHVPKDVLADAILSWELLKNGGILIFDDYKYKNGNETPGIAIDAFLQFFKDDLTILYKGVLQVIVKKNKQD